MFNKRYLVYIREETVRQTVSLFVWTRKTQTWEQVLAKENQQIIRRALIKFMNAAFIAGGYEDPPRLVFNGFYATDYIGL